MKRILLLGVIILATSSLFTQIESVQSGDWSAPSTWDGGIVPNDDEAEILTGHTVTMTGDVSCIGVYVNSGAVFNLGGNRLTLEEYLEADGGTISAETSTIEIIGSQRTMEVLGELSIGTLIFENTRSSGKITVSGLVRIIDSLVLVDGIFYPNGNVILQANSSKSARLGTVSNDATIEGQINYEVYFENGNDNMQWRYYSFPGTDLDADDLQSDGGYFTGTMVTNPSTSKEPQTDRTYESIREYNESGQVYNVPVSNLFQVGTGYAVYDYNFNPSSSYTHLMTPVVGDQSLPVTYTGSGDADLDGWNLVGNPYMSPIDWDNVTIVNSENAVYYNDNASGSVVVRTYNGGVGSPVGVTSNIAGGQAFWVHATSASPSVTVHESSKANVSQTTLYKKSPIKNIIRLKLLSSNGVADEAVVRFKDDASDDFDGSYDAYKRWQGQVMLSTHYSESAADENRMTLAINALRFNEYDTIPLVLENLEVGDYNLSILENTVLDEVTLIDLETKTEIKLSEITNYVISVEAGEDVITDKYALVTKTRTDKNYEEETAKDVTSLTGVESKETNMRLAVYPNPATGKQLTLSYAELNAGTAIIRLVDMMGVAVHTEQVQVATSGEYILPITNYNNGVYSLIVSQNDEQIAKKIIINKK